MEYIVVPFSCTTPCVCLRAGSFYYYRSPFLLGYFWPPASPTTVQQQSHISIISFTIEDSIESIVDYVPFYFIFCVFIPARSIPVPPTHVGVESWRKIAPIRHRHR